MSVTIVCQPMEKVDLRIFITFKLDHVTHYSEPYHGSSRPCVHAMNHTIAGVMFPTTEVVTGILNLTLVALMREVFMDIVWAYGVSNF